MPGTVRASGYVDMQVDSISQSVADPIPVNAPVTQSIQIENSGTDPAVAPTMTVTLASGIDQSAGKVTVTTDNGTCAYVAASNTVYCTFASPMAGTLGGGGSAVHVAVTFTPTSVGSLATTALVADPADTNSSNDSETNTTTVVQSSDLTISSLTASSPVIASGQATLTTIVHNNGTYTADDSIITFTTPTGLNYASYDNSTGWTCGAAGSTVTCSNPSSIATGADAPPLRWTGTVSTSSGNITVSEAVSSTTPDSNGSNNIASLDVPVTAGADLTVTKSVSANPVIGGQPVTFTLNSVNKGPFGASNVVVTDTLDPMFSNISASGPGEEIELTGMALHGRYLGWHKSYKESYKKR